MATESRGRVTKTSFLFPQGCGKGILRSIWIGRDMKADLVPVDIPINLMVAAGWCERDWIRDS